MFYYIAKCNLFNMKKIYFYFFILISFLKTGNLYSQCSTLVNAVPGITLPATNPNNNSGVAWNPNAKYYYGVRAGNPTFSLETYDASGNLLNTTTAGYDHRGMWWNPNTNQLEGNGYNAVGICFNSLDASLFASSTWANLLPANQPNAQSCGDYDWNADEIIYYYSGSIYRYSRATNALIATTAISGLPVPTGNLNWTSVVYTGCVGREIGVFDYVNRRLLFINKATMTYVDASQLPASAPNPSGFRISWANDLLWVFDGTTWFSYQTLDVVPLPVEFLAFTGSQIGKDVVLDWKTVSEKNNKGFDVERSVDGENWEIIEWVDGKINSNDVQTYQITDKNPVVGNNYYRLKQEDLDGNYTYSNVVNVFFNESNFGLVFYPNPVVDFLKVKETDSQNFEFISIFDSKGGKINLNYNSNSGIDMSELKSGVYFLHYQLNNESFVKPIMKK